MMMKFSAVMEELMKEVKAGWNEGCKTGKKASVAVREFCEKYGINRAISNMFRACVKGVRFVASTIRGCCLNMLYDIFAGILPIARFALSISFVALVISYFINTEYAWADFFFPITVGSAILYIVCSFFERVFRKMLRNKRSEVKNTKA